MVQALLGCEVAAEIGHLDIAYGIVTNYVQWNFLHSLDESIELEECSVDWARKGLLKYLFWKSLAKFMQCFQMNKDSYLYLIFNIRNEYPFPSMIM